MADQDKAEHPMDQVAEKGQFAAQQVKEKSQLAAETAQAKADEGIDRAAEATQGLADTLHRQADSLPGGGRTTKLAHQAAGGLERSAEYLREKDLADLPQDLENMIRRYPTQSLAVGVAVGFLLARALR
jgi:DNA-directed RNA polymerase specialized sigma54-like protein